MRWGRDPCHKQEMLDISAQLEEEPGFCRNVALVMEGPFLKVDGTPFDIEGYRIRSHRSTIHRKRQHMDNWLGSGVIQSLLLRHIQEGGQLQTVTTLVIGEDVSASMNHTVPDSTTSGDGSTETHKAVTHAS
jgi:hypothetical protein